MIKKRFILVIMIILTFSISLVSANEDLNNVGYSDDLQVNSTYSGSVLTAPGNAGTFSDLNSNIQANSNIILDKDYWKKLMVKKVFTILMNWISVFVKPVRLVKKVTV